MLAQKAEQAAEEYFADYAYNLAQDNVTEYREHEKEHKIASIKAEIESVEARNNDQSITAEILKTPKEKALYGVPRSAIDRISVGLDSKLSKLRGQLAELEAQGVTVVN